MSSDAELLFAFLAVRSPDVDGARAKLLALLAVRPNTKSGAATWRKMAAEVLSALRVLVSSGDNEACLKQKVLRFVFREMTTCCRNFKAASGPSWKPHALVSAGLLGYPTDLLATLVSEVLRDPGSLLVPVFKRVITSFESELPRAMWDVASTSDDALLIDQKNSMGEYYAACHSEASIPESDDGAPGVGLHSPADNSGGATSGSSSSTSADVKVQTSSSFRASGQTLEDTLTRRRKLEEVSDGQLQKVEEIQRIIQQKESPFRVLEVRFGASLEDTVRQFKRKALLVHPDKCHNAEGAQSAFAILHDAMEQMKRWGCAR